MPTTGTSGTSSLKNALKRKAPAAVLDPLIGLKHSIAWRYNLRSQKPVSEMLVASYGDRVRSGPFAGARMVPNVDDGCLLPKLVGSYEAELHPTIEALVEHGFSRVVDVGCASGWYVVGFACRLPDAQIHAFDIDTGAIQRCRANVALNGCTDPVHFGSLCTTAELERLAGSDALVVMDIEGGEVELLDPERCPSLRSTHVLVELHDFLRPGTSDLIVERFSSSHDVQIIETAGQRSR